MYIYIYIYLYVCMYVCIYIMYRPAADPKPDAIYICRCHIYIHYILHLACCRPEVYMYIYIYCIDLLLAPSLSAAVYI